MESISEEDEPKKKKTKIQIEASISNCMNAKADNGGTIKYRNNTLIAHQQINNYVSEPAVHGPTSIGRDSLEQKTNDLSEKLKTWYKVLKLPTVPWKDDEKLLLGSYVDLLLGAQQQCTSIKETNDDERCSSNKETDNDEGSISSEETDNDERNTSSEETDNDEISTSREETDGNDRTICIEEIFDENAPVPHGAKGIGIYEKAPKRILISAPPGYGKTTLAHKIIHDWAHQEKEYVKRFKLAFLIKLRFLKKNVKREIANIAKTCGFESTNADVKEIVNKNASSTIVILDGLDELKPGERIKVYKVLFRSELFNATVVTTCRTGCYTMTREEKERLFNGVEKSIEFQDRTVTIKGLSESNREKLLGMFVQSPDKDDVINRIRKIIDKTQNLNRRRKYTENRELFQCPLFVTLSAFILQDKSDVVIVTKNDLYKCLFDCIIRRSCCKNGTELPNDFTVFGTQEEWADKRNVVYQFGKLSAEALGHRYKSLQFDLNEQTDDIYDMGFFIKHCEVINSSKRYFYETFHLSILEFASAYSLWLDYKNNDCVVKNETIRKIIYLLNDVNVLSLSVAFLFGLLNDELSNFLNDLIPYRYCFVIPDQKLSYFDDCKSVSNFSDTVHVLFQNCISKQYWFNRMQLCNKFFPWKTLALYSVIGRDFIVLSQSAVVNYLQILINSRSNCDLPMEFNFNNIRCKKLKFTIQSNAKNIEMWLQIFNAIPATEAKRLRFMYDSSLVTTSMTNDLAKDDENFPKCTRVTLKTDAVRDITNLSRVVTESFTQLGASRYDILPAMSVFADLKTVCIYDYKNNLDLSLLTNFGKKHWESVHLIRVKMVNCSSELVNHKCVSSFRNLDCVNSPAVFGSIVPDILHCDDDYIIEAFESSSFLSRWLTVKELILELDDVKNYTEIMSCLARLCRIHTPKIRLRFNVYYSEEFDCVGTCNEHAVIEFLKSICVTEILYTYDTILPRSHRECCLFLQFARTVHEKQIRLHTLIISQNSEGWINDAFTCVSDGNVVRCIVVLDSERGKRLSLDVVNRFDFTKFNIQFGYSRDYFTRQNCVRSYDRRTDCICISLKQGHNKPYCVLV